LLAVIGVAAAVSCPAWAADMAVKAPIAPAPVAVAAYNWSGFFIGAEGGYVGGDKDWTFNSFATPAGTLVPIVPPTVASHSVSGGFAGGTIGYNWQTGPFVLGVETSWGWASATGSSACPAPNIGGICSTEVRWIGTAAGRLGYATGPALLYVKGGGAWAGDRYNVDFAAVPTGNELGRQTRDGWMVGAGGEYLFTPNWSLKAEYNYLDFGTKGGAMYRCGTCTANGLAGGALDENVDFRQRLHVFKVGVNYHFGAFGGPLVAKY
jgi:outer membrane immunogenic protein